MIKDNDKVKISSTEEDDFNRDKAFFFKQREEKVHIKLKTDRFYNGYIKEIDEEFLLLEDDVFGEIPVFFIEIFKIEKVRERVE